MKAALWPVSSAARVAVWLIALSTGCGSGNAPADAPVERPRGTVPTEDHAPIAEKPVATAAVRPVEDQPTAAAAPTAAAEEVKKDDAPPRDYSAELLAALGAPVDCLRQRTAGEDAPSELRIDVQAYLLESGFVSRAYARSPALDAQEAQCLTKRASALRLTAPIEAAPRAVSATLVLTLQPAPKPATEEPTPAEAKTEENP